MEEKKYSKGEVIIICLTVLGAVFTSIATVCKDL